MRKAQSKLLYAIIASALVFVIVIIVNFIASVADVRVDCTEDQLYTLSQNSKNILKKLDTPVTIRFYFSKNSNQMPVFFKNFAKRIEDLLDEYQEAGGKNIIIAKFDPEPDSDAEDSALMDGVRGQMLSNGEKIYLGIAISCLDETVAIPFIPPDRENMLEYDITSAISQVSLATKPVVGVMSTLPVMGEKFNPMMLQMGQMPQAKPWMIIKELKKTFDVRQLEMTEKEIPADIKVLIVIHPSGITDSTQFAIDQFVMRGGKLIAFLDPKSYYSEMNSKKNNPMQRGPAKNASSTLDKLLKAWGLKFDLQQVVADVNFSRRINHPQKQLNFTTVLDITKKGLDSNDVTTSDLNKLTMVFAGAFTGEPADGLNQSILVKTTEKSDLTNVYAATQPEMAFKSFEADEAVYNLAVRLSGKFKTAFPNGAPKEDEKDEKKGEKEKKEEKPASDFLKECANDNTVILVGDTDILVDDVCVRVGNILGQQFMMPLNDNLSFFQNVADNMGGDQELIGIRCRQTISRPFEVVKELQAVAEQRFKEKITELEKDLRETESRLNSMQKGKSKDKQTILTPAQQAELKKFQKKRVEVNKDLKRYRRELRKDIVSLENRLKWINIALMPAIVIAFGIIVAIVRKKRSAAQ